MSRAIPGNLSQPRDPLFSPKTAARSIRCIVADRRFLFAATALFYAVFFVFMTKNGLKSYFSQDDLLNIYYCWSRSLSHLLLGGTVIAGNAYRPAGELLYDALFALFGFHPAAFNVVRLILCCVDAGLLYLFARRISNSVEVGVLALLIGGFHPGTHPLYFDTGMIFDVLAFLFFYAALAVYVRSRSGGAFPSRAKSVLVLALYLLALDSKEIAVTFPIALFLFELTRGEEGVAASFRSGRGFLRKFRITAIATLMTAVFIVARSSGPEALVKIGAYHPKISAAAYVGSYARYMAELTFLDERAIQPLVPWILGGCIALSVPLRNRTMLWASLFNVLSILPLAFIPPRAGFAFAVPLAGWTVYCAALVAWLRARIVSRKPRLEWLSQAVVFCLIAFFLLRPEAAYMRDNVRPFVHDDQNFVRRTIESLHTVLPAKLVNKRVLALRDPFRNGYGLIFAIQLSYNDPSVTVDTFKLLELRREPISRVGYDYVIDWTGERFVGVQNPGP